MEDAENKKDEETTEAGTEEVADEQDVTEDEDKDEE